MRRSIFETTAVVFTKAFNPSVRFDRGNYTPQFRALNFLVLSPELFRTTVVPASSGLKTTFSSPSRRLFVPYSLNEPVEDDRLRASFAPRVDQCIFARETASQNLLYTREPSREFGKVGQLR